MQKSLSHSEVRKAPYMTVHFFLNYKHASSLPTTRGSRIIMMLLIRFRLFIVSILIAYRLQKYIIPLKPPNILSLFYFFKTNLTLLFARSQRTVIWKHPCFTSYLIKQRPCCRISRSTSESTYFNVSLRTARRCGPLGSSNVS